MNSACVWLCAELSGPALLRNVAALNWHMRSAFYAVISLIVPREAAPRGAFGDVAKISKVFVDQDSNLGRAKNWEQNPIPALA